MEHILILCTAEWLALPFLKLDGSLQAKIWGRQKQNSNESIKMRFQSQILKKIYHFKKVEYIKELNQNITCSFKQIAKMFTVFIKQRNPTFIIIMILLRRC